jgi:CHAT domain-containing protein/tetratricopeptide (TPR) repeat protein
MRLGVSNPALGYTICGMVAVDAGSMGKAAKLLATSQPAISRSIAEPEHALGVLLLDRTAQGIEPTPYGRALLKRGTAVFDELQQDIKDIRFLSDPAGGPHLIVVPACLHTAQLAWSITESRVMADRWLRGLVAILLAVAASATTGVWAQGADDLAALNSQVVRLHREGKFTEAAEVARNVLSLVERQFGPEHLVVSTSLNNLAELYRVLGRYSDAEPLVIRALAIREKALGLDHPDVGQPLNTLANLYYTQARYAEAEPLYQRALSIGEKALGPEHPEVGIWLNNLAEIYRAQARYAEAEPLYKRALSINEKALGPDHPSLGISLNNLAELYRAQARYAEAEPLYQRALSIGEKALGSDHLFVGTALEHLAEVYNVQGRYAEAEPLYRRSLAIMEKTFGPDHLDVGTSLNNLAGLYYAQARHADAEPLYQRSLAITEKALGPEHPWVGTNLNNLAELYIAQGRYAEAEPLYQRSLAITEKALGPEHPWVALKLNNLAILYRNHARYAEAETLSKRALAITENALGADHPDVGNVVNNLAGHAFVQRDWQRAADYWRRSTRIIIRRVQRGIDDIGKERTGKKKSEAEQLSYQFFLLAKAAARFAEDGRSAIDLLAREMFQIAQWAQGSQAAASLAQMAARGAKGNSALAVLVRERQDLVTEWQKRDEARSASLSRDLDKRDRAAEAANASRLAEIDARIAVIDMRLKAQFPDYAALANPEPLTVEEVQAYLRPNEALILFLDTPEWKPTPEETFIWVVTKSDMRWVRSKLGTLALRHEVAALRCGLDAAAWDGEGVRACAQALALGLDQAPKEGQPLPFRTIRAHALYKALFGEVGDLIPGKHLLVVPSGPLTQLPFQVLVSAPPLASDDFRATAWLGKSHAIAVLPAASSLKALRRDAKPSQARRPLIGFGNPLLDGDPVARPWEAEWAKHARQKQACPQTSWQRVAGLLERRRSIVSLAINKGRADLDHLRSQSPLHETADELCAVAKDLMLMPDDILLGAKATETVIKKLSSEGKLTSYRVVHFATHGTLSGEVEGTNEPGLILTPPKEQTDDDDGYLSASEVAALKLDADWVILSACNTAAGGSDKAEALSGLARAFFYAGARALLVSHWAVDSAATVKLITQAVGATARDRKMSRAEALRLSMMAMIDQGESRESHPALWAPFVVVGEGAAGR